MPTSRRRHPIVTVAIALALVAFPLGALASHDFLDVPDSNPFHADISALADSGVTTGCGGGNFCPSAFVTREQMAAFMNRLGALAPEKTPVVNAATAEDADALDGLDSSQFLRSDVPITRYVSCPGIAWQPLDSTVAWDTSSSGIYPTAGSSTAFLCALYLPQGASLVEATFGIKDSSATEEIAGCEVRRTGITLGLVGLFGQTAASGIANAPGVTTLTDGLATHVVDNTDVGYWAYCTVAGTGDDVQVLGVVIELTVTGAV